MIKLAMACLLLGSMAHADDPKQLLKAQIERECEEARQMSWNAEDCEDCTEQESEAQWDRAYRLNLHAAYLAGSDAEDFCW